MLRSKRIMRTGRCTACCHKPLALAKKYRSVHQNRFHNSEAILRSSAAATQGASGAVVPVVLLLLSLVDEGNQTMSTTNKKENDNLFCLL
jgi:hypothetical protein